MNTGWTAPGTTEGSSWQAPGSTAGPDADQARDGHSWPGRSGAPQPPGPQRELVQQVPLFPLRPLNVGEILGAAVRIYRLRPKPVLGLSAAVYGIAFVLITLTTGAGMIPMIGQMQATIEDPTGDALETTVGGTLSNALTTIASSMITMVVTVVAASLVTVVLTRISIGEATGHRVPDGQIWSQLRRQALPAIGIALVIGAATTLAFAIPLALGAVPVLILQEASWLTIVPIVLGLGLGLLATLWVWARTVMALPALAVEEAGVWRSLRRSLAMTAGRRLWRVLGLTLLVMVLYYIAQQVIAGVFGFVAGILYMVVLLATSFQAIVLAIALLTVLAMIGSYLATFLLAPFLSSGFAAVYADARMRHEAWDVELTRQARAPGDTGSPGAPPGGLR